MRIVVGPSIARSVPGLESCVVDSSVDSAFGAFDQRISSESITGKISEVRPEVVVVDVSWLGLSTFLSRCLVVSDCPHALRVVGSTSSSDALKIQAARRGFFDIVDVGQSAGEVHENLGKILGGESKLRRDRLWSTIDALPANRDRAEAMADAMDVEIIELLSVGLSDREIALGVHLSLQAVRNRVSAMLDRSGCVNRTQLAWEFTSQGLAELLTQSAEVSSGSWDMPSREYRGDGTE